MAEAKQFMPIKWHRYAATPKPAATANTQNISRNISPEVNSALRNASRQTGTQYDYLVKTAQRESSFNPQAKASTSSAAGLFQFIESTWLQVMKEQGHSIGLGHYAKYIEKTRRGYEVKDPQNRKSILDLRYNPNVAAKMAGALTNQNQAVLRQGIGRSATAGELYIAHFLGAEGATKLIKTAWSNPNVRADKYFLSAARANTPIFYKNGKARSVSEVYHLLTQKFDRMIEERQNLKPAVAQKNNNQLTMPVEPSKIFQGLFFEAAEKARLQIQQNKQQLEKADPNSLFSAKTENDKPTNLQLFAQNDNSNIDSKEASEYYEKQIEKSQPAKNFFSLLR